MATCVLLGRACRLYFGVKRCFPRHDSVQKAWKFFSGRPSIPKIAGFATAAAAVVENSTESQKLKNVDPAKLTSTYLLKNAAAANVDTAMAMFNQTTATFLDIHSKYIESINKLLQLQDMLINSLDNTYQEQTVWDAMLAIRKQVNDYKAAISELQFLYSCAERALHNASEAAFLTGAEYASSVASERLHSAQLRMNSANEEMSKQELAISQKEAWVIQETAKHDKKEKEAEQGDSDGGDGDTEKTNENLAELRPNVSQEPMQSKQDLDDSHGSNNWFDVVFSETEQNEMKGNPDPYEDTTHDEKWTQS